MISQKVPYDYLRVQRSSNTTVQNHCDKYFENVRINFSCKLFSPNYYEKISVNDAIVINSFFRPYIKPRRCLIMSYNGNNSPVNLGEKKT